MQIGVPHVWISVYRVRVRHRIRKELHASWCHASQETQLPALSARPRTYSGSPRHTILANDPCCEGTAMINTDDPHLMSQLLRLLETQLDKHVDACRYASPITAKRDRHGRN